MIAIGVFLFFYIIVRLVESYFIPLIPEFIRNEIMALVRWSPVLIPVIFGLAYMRPKRSGPTDQTWEREKNMVSGTVQETDDEILRKRMGMVLK
jgi:hypothetical protein